MHHRKAVGLPVRTTLLQNDIIPYERNARRNEKAIPKVAESIREFGFMTPGRIYVHVGGDELKSIVYFDGDNKRVKQIDLDHRHLGAIPHAHDGYFHSDFRKSLTEEERALVDRVYNLWSERR